MYTVKDLRTDNSPKEIIAIGYYDKTGYYEYGEHSSPYDLLKNHALIHINIISDDLVHGVFNSVNGKWEEEGLFKVKITF